MIASLYQSGSSTRPRPGRPLRERGGESLGAVEGTKSNVLRCRRAFKSGRAAARIVLVSGHAPSLVRGDIACSMQRFERYHDQAGRRRRFARRRPERRRNDAARSVDRPFVLHDARSAAVTFAEIDSSHFQRRRVIAFAGTVRKLRRPLDARRSGLRTDATDWTFFKKCSGKEAAASS